MSPPIPTALVAITKQGSAHAAHLAQQLPQAQLFIASRFADSPPLASFGPRLHRLEGAIGAAVGQLFQRYQRIAFFVSLGAVVRLIAPHLRSKEQDPGVVVIDDAGRFVIPLLSGHLGGANAFAAAIAQLLGATAVITTASDVGGTIAVDLLGRELGWRLEAPKINVTRVAAHLVNQEPVAFIQEAGARNWWRRPTPLPANIVCFERFEAVDLHRFSALLWVTQRPIEEALWQRLAERLVVYRPPLGQQ